MGHNGRLRVVEHRKVQFEAGEDADVLGECEAIRWYSATALLTLNLLLLLNFEKTTK